jgi:hypothetical protein
MADRGHSAIARCIDALRAAGATDVDQYKQRLRSNANQPDVLEDFLLEGRAALMFLRHGFKVAMQERPDLRIELHGEVVYVEVKHFREKEQDLVDEKAMRRAAGLLVRTGEVLESEGAEAWEQMLNVAMGKADQYASDAPNVLVIESSSPSLELMLGTAVGNYDQQVLKCRDIRLRRLSGIMLVQTEWVTCGEGRNVYFCPTRDAATPLSARMTAALSSIITDMPCGEQGECA